jgi:hypothetical protein
VGELTKSLEKIGLDMRVVALVSPTYLFSHFLYFFLDNLGFENDFKFPRDRKL